MPGSPPSPGSPRDDSLLLLDLQEAGFLLGPFRRRHGDLEHAVVELGGRLCRVGALWERDGAVEAAVGALAVIVAFPLLLLLVLPLPLDREYLVGDLDLDVVLSHPRQVSADYVPAVVMQDVDPRRPFG